MKKRLGIIAGVLLMLVMGMTVWAADAGMNIEIKKNQVFQVNSDADLHEQPDAESAVAATLPGGTPVIAKEDAKDGWCLVAYQTQTGYVQTSILGLLGSPVIPAAVEDQPEIAVDETQPDEAASESSVNETDMALSPDEAGADDSAAAGGETDDGDLTGGAAEPAPGEDNTRVQNNALDEEFRSVQEANRMAYQEAENAEKQASSEKMWGIVIAVLVVAIFAVGIITTLAGNKGKKK